MRVLVVGGSSSLGLRIVKSLVARGDSVVATYANAKPPDVAAFPRLRHLHLDLLDDRSFETVVSEIVQVLGAIDAAILLAGILPGKSLADYTAEMMQRVVTVNFAAQALLIKALLPVMAEDSQVLLVSSMSAERGSFDPIYAATKAALIGLTKSLALWHGKRTRFNCITPTLIEDSTMYRDMLPDRREYHRKNSPTGELLQLDDFASVVVNLMEPHWRHLNGAVIRLSGGNYL